MRNWMRRSISMTVAWACLSATLLAQTSTPKVFVIKCGMLLDGKSESARKNVTIRVEGDRIAAVGDAGAI